MLRRPEDIEQIPALTREDIKRLRSANVISFRRSPSWSGITAAKEKTLAAGTKREWEHEVPAHSTIKACYGTYPEPEDRPPLAEVAVCHHWVPYADNVHEPLRTIFSLLKAGDRLELEWTRDAHTNGYMKDAGLHGDRLQLVVHRKDKRLLFLIHAQCCKDNTARLIRRGVYNMD